MTCNRLALLKECVAHASNQEKMPEKIIIINNASTDGTLEYLQEEQFQSPLYHIVNESENLAGQAVSPAASKQRLLKRETGFC